MFAYGLYFAFQEAVAVLVVAYLPELGVEGGAFSYPSIEVLQGGGGFSPGAVELRQFYFGIGPDDKVGLFLGMVFGLVHDADFLFLVFFYRKDTDNVCVKQEK